MAFTDISSTISDPQQFLRGLGVTPAMIGDLVLDVVVREAPDHSWLVTKHKTEAGYEATDLRIKNPDVLVLDVVFVDKKYGPRDLIANTLSGEGLAPNTWRDKYFELKEVWANDEPTAVVTGLDSYANMVISNVSPIREASSAGSLVFTVTLEEVRIVDTEFVEVDNALMPAPEKKTSETSKKQAKKKNKKVDKQTPPKQEEKQSMLHSLVGG